MFRFLFSCILIVFLTAQCTIQKRLYNKGYSVSWNKRFREESKEIKNVTDEDNSSEKQEIRNESTDSAVAENADQESISTDNLEIVDPVEPILFDESKLKEPLADTIYIRSVNVPSGVAALGLLGGSLVTFGAAIVIGLDFLLIASVLLMIASFILAIISLVEFHRNRKLYLSNTCGVIAMVIDSIFLAFTLVGLILVLIFVF